MMLDFKQQILSKIVTPEIIKNDLCELLRFQGETHPTYQTFCHIPTSVDDNLPDANYADESSVVYSTLMGFMGYLMVAASFLEPESKRYVPTDKTTQDVYEIEQFEIDEQEFMARRGYLRQLTREYETIAKQLAGQGYHREAVNTVIRYCEYHRIKHEIQFGLSGTHPLQAELDWLKQGNKPLIAAIWEHRERYASFQFHELWLKLSEQESKRFLASRNTHFDDFFELRLREHEGILRTLTPGRFEALIRRFSNPIKIGNALFTGYITSFGTSAFLLGLGVLPVASIPALTFLVAGYTMLSTYQSNSRRLAHNTALIVRGLFDKGLPTYCRRHWVRLLLTTGLTLAGCAGGSYLVYLSVNTQVAVACMIGSLYASAFVRGPTAWQSLNALVQRVKRASKAWRSETSLNNKVRSFIQALVGVSAGSMTWSERFANLTCAGIIAISGWVGGSALFEHLPKIIAASPGAELSLCLLISVLSQQTLKTLRILPYVHQSFLSFSRAVEKICMESPAQSASRIISSTVEPLLVVGLGVGTIITISTSLPVTVPAVLVTPALLALGLSVSGVSYYIIVPLLKQAVALFNETIKAQIILKDTSDLSTTCQDNVPLNSSFLNKEAESHPAILADRYKAPLTGLPATRVDDLVADFVIIHRPF